MIYDLYWQNVKYISVPPGGYYLPVEAQAKAQAWGPINYRKLTAEKIKSCPDDYFVATVTNKDLQDVADFVHR